MDDEKEILQKVDEIHERYKERGRAWNKLRGDAVERIVAYYLQKHLQDVKVVQTAWIDGYSTEFDLLIVSEDAQPIGFTNAYPKEQVQLGLEVKASGLHSGYKGVENYARHIAKLREATGKPILYLSFWDHRKYRDILIEVLGEDTIFSTKSGKRDIRSSEWNRFVEKVQSILAE